MITVTPLHAHLADLIAHHGILRFPAAYCRERGWRRGAQGRAPEWYKAWTHGLGEEVERVLAGQVVRSDESNGAR